MKRFFAFLAVASAAILLGSCAKEHFNDDVPSGSTKLVLSMPGAKTYLGELKEGKRPLYWSTGDSIAVNGVVSEPLEKGDTSVAEFTFKGILSTPYKIAYPASLWTSETTVTLPKVAKYIPLIGYKSESGSASVNYVTSVMHFKIKKGTADSCKIAYVEVSAEGIQMSGVFNVDFEKGTISSSESSVVNNSVRSTVNAFLGDEVTDVFIPVPIGTYAAKVKIVDAKGHYMEQAISSREFTAGKIFSFPKLTFTPTGTLIDVNIKTAADWNTFATNFNKGEFDDVTPLVVSIDADLDFENGSPVRMIGSFGGIIYGNDHYFKNMQITNHSLVDTVGANGCIKGVKISDSKLTVTSEATSTYFGSMVTDLQGRIEDCESSADVDFVVSSSTAWFIGGLVGRIRGGSADNCLYSGTMKDVETTDIGANYSYVGGITGDVNNNPAETQNGSITDCEFSGKILMGPTAGTSTGTTGITSSSGTGFRVGGIVGRAQNGTVTGCSTTDAAVVDVRGDMIQIYVGGIVGNAQDNITGCTNAASVSIWSANTDAGGGYAQVGGIAGSNSKEVSGCNNTGAINMKAGHRNSFYGGIVGRNTGTVSNCTNSGAIKEDTYRPRYLYIAGVLGGNYGTVTDVHNTGAVTVSYVPVNATMGTTGCGGVIGYNGADISGDNKIDNTGTVTVNINKTAYLNVSAGGIIGINKASLSGVTNKGKVLSTCSAAVATSTASPFFTAFGGIIGSQQNGATAATISDCTNDRDTLTAKTEFIYANITSTTSYSCMNWCEGGVIGYAYDSNLTVENCSNNAYVIHKANTNTSGTSTKTNNRTSFTGGIIGRVSAATQTTNIRSCTNKGRCQSTNYNTSVGIAVGPFNGGIVGAAEGATGKKITIQNCDNSDEAGAKPDDVYMNTYRGTSGGVVGYASYVDVSNCTVSKKITGNGNADYFGGMVGQAYNTTISEGVMSSLMPIGKNLGGVVSILGSGSSVTGSKYAGTISGASVKYGAIAAVSEAGTTITDAKIASTAKVMDKAASADNSYVCGDTNATISGTTIE